MKNNLEPHFIGVLQEIFMFGQSKLEKSLY